MCDNYQMCSPRTAIVCKCAILVCRKMSYKVSLSTEAWPFGLADNSYPGVARFFAPRECLPLVKTVWFIFHFQKRDNYQVCSPITAFVC